MPDSFDYSVVNSENAQLLRAVIDDAPEYTKETGSRNAEILKSIINDTEYTDAPQSEIEELLLELKEKIAGGGGDITVESLNVTANGTYQEEGKAYSPVVVNVPTPEDSYQLKSLPTGAISSITDGANLPMPSLKIGIEPIQEGSGDPSPENIRPISGWSAVDVTKSGKNRLPATIEGIKAANTSGSWSGNVYTLNGVAFTIQTDTDENITGIMLNGTSTAVTFFYINSSFTIKAGLYVLNGAPLSSGTETWRLQVNIPELYIDTGGGANLTVSEDYSGAISFIRVGANRTPSNVLFYPMIRLASETDATFEPYNPNSETITIQLGDTYYGGTLDVVSGELKVVPYYDSYNGETLEGEWISDRDVYAVGTTPTIGAQVVNIGATPQTIQLTPTAVKSLLGTNNIWADTGDVMSGEYFSKL